MLYNNYPIKIELHALKLYIHKLYNIKSMQCQEGYIYLI